MPKPTALTIGIFDGVHLGHQQLIKATVKLARKKGLQSVLMTFDPHPAKILSPKGIKSLFSLGDRLSMVKAMGVEEVIVIPFTKELSALSPQDFFKKYILKDTHTKELVVGYDFTFGKDRQGDTRVLHTLCEENEIGFQVQPAFEYSNEVVSSSRIRKLVEVGQVSLAGELLSRSFYLEGTVVKGAGRGRTIGIPTANLFTKAELFPKKGVYLTWVEHKEGKSKAVTNVGDNPTFENSKSVIPKVESHILDFSEDIYNEKIKVHFIERLRDEKKFSSVDELIEQIGLDIQIASKFKWPKK